MYVALKACSNVKDKQSGKRVHEYILKNTRLYDSANNVQLFTALMLFYGKIGEIDEVVKIFNEINEKNKDLICYNIMMQAYLHNNRPVFFKSKTLEHD